MGAIVYFLPRRARLPSPVLYSNRAKNPPATGIVIPVIQESNHFVANSFRAYSLAAATDA